jgi:hypothetical protein
MRAARLSHCVAITRVMWLEAILSRHDLEEVLRELTPATLALGEHGTVCLGPPTEVTLLEARGLRVACPVTIHGSVLGLSVPIRVESATFCLEPSIASRAGRDVLVFKVVVEAIDVAALPHIVEGVAVDAMNSAIVAHETELTWDFRKTLSHRFSIADGHKATRKVDVSAAWGKVRITAEAFVLAVSVHAVAGLDHAPATVQMARRHPTRERSRWAPALLVAVSGLLAFSLGAVGVAAWRTLARRSRRRLHAGWPASS